MGDQAGNPKTPLKDPNSKLIIHQLQSPPKRGPGAPEGEQGGHPRVGVKAWEGAQGAEGKWGFTLTRGLVPPHPHTNLREPRNGESDTISGGRDDKNPLPPQT